MFLELEELSFKILMAVFMEIMLSAPHIIISSKVNNIYNVDNNSLVTDKEQT